MVTFDSIAIFKIFATRNYFIQMHKQLIEGSYHQQKLEYQQLQDNLFYDTVTGHAGIELTKNK